MKIKACSLEFCFEKKKEMEKAAIIFHSFSEC